MPRHPDYTTADVGFLIQFFKLLADQTRLEMIGRLAQKKYSVGELAKALELTEPTISHHLAKLRDFGLVNLEAIGTKRLYWLNQPMLDRMRGWVNHLEHIDYSPTPNREDDTAWVDALTDLDEADRKVLKGHTYQGRLKHIPAKRKKLEAVLRWLVRYFEPNRTYTEAEVNDVIGTYADDYVTIRRELINYHYLARERDGRAYWLKTP